MRLPRFRFTVRMLMVAVAIVAMVTSAAVLKRYRDGFLERARFHAMIEKAELGFAESGIVAAESTREFAKWARKADSIPRLVVHPTSRPDDEYVFIPQDDPPARVSPDQLEQDASRAEASASK